MVAMVAGNTIGAGAVAVLNLPMQLDGNTTATDATQPPYDWESFFQGPGDITQKSGALPTGVLALGQNVDYMFPESTTFATGSKDTLNIGAITSPKKLAAGWQCGNSNNLGAKDDLVNVYTVAYRDPTTQHLFLYFGAEKSSNLGDNNIGIWFLQDSSVGCTIQSGRNTDFSGHHVPGDVLLTAAFTKGGAEAAVESHLWVAGPDNGGEGLLGAADGGFLCTNGATSIDKACAITNLTDFDPPWNHPVKTPGANGTALAPQEFYEGGVDVTQLVADTGQSKEPCITTFVADTRSSQSPTATLFDFARGAFPVCHPGTAMSASPAQATPATIYSGGSQTFTFSDYNDGDVTLSNPSVSTTTAGCLTPSYVSGDANNDGKLNPLETWTWSCTLTNITSTTTITATGHGTDPLGRDVTFCGASDATHVCDAEEQAVAKVVVISPSTTLLATAATASPNPAHIDQTVTFTFYETNDGDVDLTAPSLSTANSTCSSTMAKTAESVSPADGKLNPGETWTFQCTTKFSGAGSQSVTVTGHGTDPLGADVTFCPTSDATHRCDAQEQTSASVRIISPATELKEAVSAVITFTYYEKNTGDSVISNPTVDSTQCTSATPVKTDGVHVDGDTDQDGKLDVNETWVFKCTVTKSLPADQATSLTSDTGTGHGTDEAGGAVSTNGEIDSSSVTLNNAN